MCIAVNKGLTVGERSLDYHEANPKGKLEVRPTKPCETEDDLSLAYTPGVAAPCLAIEKVPEDAYRYTSKGNLIAVVTNGTAVLGLGDIGALAGKPVMEGKSVLFKRFGAVNCIDLEVDERDPKKFVEIVKAVSCTFGGLNLEDIKAPECFYIEDRLREELEIPVFHDDQHGTAIVIAAGLLNALDMTGRKIETARVVINGAGAAALATLRFLKTLGMKGENVVVCDRQGPIYTGRGELTSVKAEVACQTPYKDLADALRGADVFLGLSSGNILNEEMLISMTKAPIIFAMANPTPEIPYADARCIRPDAILATGRSDAPNQVNNVLAFPYIFRAALDTRARRVNYAMMEAASRALAAIAKNTGPGAGPHTAPFGQECIIPSPLDPRLFKGVSLAVALAAMDSGVAKHRLDLTRYEATLDRGVAAFLGAE